MRYLKPSIKFLRDTVARLAANIKKFFRSIKPNSIKFEISVIYTVVLGIILLAFSGVCYLILSRTLYLELDNELRIKAQEVSQNIRAYLEVKGEDVGTLNYAAEKTIAEDKPLRRWWYIGFERSWFKRLDEQDYKGDYINFVAPDGKLSLVRSPKMNEDLLQLFMADTRIPEKESFHYVTDNGRRLRIINYPFKAGDQKTYLIQIGISPQPIVQLLENWMTAIFLSIPVILILTSFLGRMLSQRILRPVEKITHAAHHITYRDLSARVAPEYFYIEMNSLVEAFNDMISRLEQSFEHIEEFSAHVAHELKTPLTIIRGENELALLEKRSPEEYRRVMRISLGETEKMLKIIDDLLYLTRMNYQPDIFKFEKLDLRQFFEEIYDHTSVLASPKRIKIELLHPQHPIFVRADPLHLRRLFLNLIDNALKFSPADEKIIIRIEQQGNQGKIAVTDKGPGIPKEALSKIFERFYRLDNQKSGNGLGLNIVQSIAKAHRGEVHVASGPEAGTTFTVILPLFTERWQASAFPESSLEKTFNDKLTVL
jgi:heavy metal sensor kinase